MNQAGRSKDQPQTFRGKNARDVFSKVRDALGPDAVIVKQHRGPGFVEVIASADFPSSVPHDPKLHRIFAERLQSLGFEADFLVSLPTDLESWRQVKSWLRGQIAISPPDSPLKGAYRFIGAPGVGKTTTIIKIIAERVLRHGRSGVLLVSADTRRLAGCEQLALTAELLQTEYLEVREADLGGVLAKHRHMELILVDTAGVCRQQEADGLKNLNNIIVLPATWQASTLQRQRRNFSSYDFSGAVITNIDQATTLGACAGVLSQWQVPVCWFSTGPELPDDLEPASMELVSDLMFDRIDLPEMNATFA
ncbi:MAG: hypothetical protein O7G86_02425 [Gammaproteobacteria bacterium]|nr:hypothetical protein [Gammaproteobacteria bacterium]